MVVEMRMIQWKRGHTRLDRFRNEVIRNKVKVVTIKDKLRENTMMGWSCRRKSVDVRVRMCG